jgi:hypothetical protein
MGAASGNEGEPSRPNDVLLTLDVEQDLAFDDVHRLVDVGVIVHGRDLAALELILEHQDRVVGLLRQRLPDVEPSAEEPPPLAVVLVAHDRFRHGVSLLRGTGVP